MKTVDLFAGCGGLSMGFQNIGFDIVAAFEFWNTAALCYESNFDHPVFRTDLSNTDVAAIEIQNFNPELIIGGPPCQDFSHAGKRIEASRANLTEAYAKIITCIKPKFFVMENVDRAEKSKAFETAKNIFIDSGYGITSIILNASKFGVPQRRKRFFCIGALGKPDGFMTQFVSNGLQSKETTLRDFFGDTLSFEFYYRHPRNYNRRAIFSIDEPAPTMRGVNRPLPKGYPGHPKDACPLSSDIRALTTLERSLIQTFPSTFKWIGTRTEIEQMIGNAVPVKLADYVACSLKAYIKAETEIEYNKNVFVDWLKVSYNYSERSAKDTLSRVRRASKICDFDSIPDDSYLFYLQQEEKYNSLSISVRSQIKRALLLYKEFIAQM